MDQLTYSGTLTMVTCWCGVRYAVPTELRESQIRMHNEGRQKEIYCPLGHAAVPSGEGRWTQLEKQLVAMRAAHDQTLAEVRTLENRNKAQKAATARIKNRVGNGVCPCCKRSFQNLRRHMSTKHPAYKVET